MASTLRVLFSSSGRCCVERVLGLGGVFFKARDPAALAAWYRDNLGVPVKGDQTYGTFKSAAAESGSSIEPTVWSTFPMDTEYFGPNAGSAHAQSCMLNYRVHDLDAMLAQLRAAGASVEERIEEYDYGRFGWATDPEGNRFELWQPR